MVVAGVLGVVALPVILVCAALVRVVDGSPVLFRQARVGRGGRGFDILKLRTMRPGDGSLVTSSGDPRITPLGRRLRRAKLDELPQLWNVLRGDMSLVGPRPETPNYVRIQPRGFRAIAPLRPGLTDWASLVFQDEEAVLSRHAGEPGFYETRLLPRKLALARLYHRKVTPHLDLVILGATALLVLGGRPMVGTVLGRNLVSRARERM